MPFNLRKFLEEAAAQLNPLDSGRTAATVRASRTPPPATISKINVQQALSSGGLRRDVPQPPPYTGPSLWQKYNPGNILSAAIEAPGKLINQPQQNRVEFSQNIKNPVVRVGTQIAEDFVNAPFTVSRGAQRIRGGDIAGGSGEVVKGILEGPGGVIPIGRTAQVVSRTPKLISRLQTGARTGLTLGTTYGGAYGTAEGFSQNASPIDIAKTGLISAAAGGAGGAVLGGAMPVVGVGIVGGSKAVRKVPEATRRAANPSSYALDQNYKQLQKQWDRATPKTRRQIEKAMALNRAEYQLVSEGGFAKIPGRQASITSVEPEIKTQTGMSEPPLPPVSTASKPLLPPPDRPRTDVGQLPSGKMQETRFASKTVPESKFVSKPVKGSIKAPQYSMQTEKQGYSNALYRLDIEGPQKFESRVFSTLDKKPGTISRQEAIDATTTAQLLDARADGESIRKATEIYEKLSEHYTAAGQTVQVAAILSRRTPEGMRGWATRLLSKEGVKPSTQVQQQIVELSQQKKFNELADLVSRQIPSSRGDKIINFWRAGLLTAPTTTGGNLLGNTGEAIVRKGFVNPVATAADTAMGLVTGKRTTTLATPGEFGKGFIKGAKELGKFTDNTKYDVKRRTNYKTKVLDAYVNNVYRLMGIADTPFSRAAEKEALSSIAKAEAINQGLKGKARSKFIQDFIDKPPEAALQRAQQEGAYAAFKNPTTLGNVASGAKRPAGPVGEFFLPFTQVPSAIATRVVERTPINIANQVVKQIRHIKAGGEFDQRAMSQAIGNGLFGPAIMGAGYALAKNDLLTFGYPKDNKERALWDEEGKQPYSVRIGDRWYSLNYLQPFGTLLAIGGQARKAANEGKDITEIVGQGMAIAGQAITNQSFLKGISGALEAITDPERSVRKYVEQTTSSVVPNVVRSLARSTDKIQRSPEGVVEGVKSGVPGLRGTTTPKFSEITGDPLPGKDNFANQYFNPLRPSKVREADITKELRRLQSEEEGVIPTQTNKNVFGKDSGITSKQVKDLDSLVAQGISDEWAIVMSDPRYQALPDEEKKKALSDISRIVSPAIKAAYAAENGFISDKWEPKLNSSQKAYIEGEIKDVLFKPPPKPKVSVKKTRKTTKRTPTRKTARRRGTRQLPQKYSGYKLFSLGVMPTVLSKSLRQLVQEAQIK